MTHSRIGKRWALALLVVVLGGCASQPAHFIRSDVDFSFIHRVAILPFQNLSTDRFAAQRLESVFLSELLRYDGLEVVDPGETLAACSELHLSAEATLSPEQIMAVGKRLGVDAVFTGSVQEYGAERLGGSRDYSVTAVFNLSETASGQMIWNAESQADGSSLWRKLFGGGTANLYDVSRKAVSRALETLLK